MIGYALPWHISLHPLVERSSLYEAHVRTGVDQQQKELGLWLISSPDRARLWKGGVRMDAGELSGWMDGWGERLDRKCTRLTRGKMLQMDDGCRIWMRGGGGGMDESVIDRNELN